MTTQAKSKDTLLEITKLVIPAVLALVASVLTYFTLQQSKVNAVKTDEVKVEASKIHTLVNSNLTDVKSELEASKKELATLRGLVEKIALKSVNENERSPK